MSVAQYYEFLGDNYESIRSLYLKRSEADKRYAKKGEISGGNGATIDLSDYLLKEDANKQFISENTFNTQLQQELTKIKNTIPNINNLVLKSDYDNDKSNLVTKSSINDIKTEINSKITELNNNLKNLESKFNN